MNDLERNAGSCCPARSGRTQSPRRASVCPHRPCCATSVTTGNRGCRCFRIWTAQGHTRQQRDLRRKPPSLPEELGDPRAEAEAEQSTFHKEACGGLVVCHTIPRWPGPVTEAASAGRCAAHSPSNSDFRVTAEPREHLSYLIVISDARVIFKTGCEESRGQGAADTLEQRPRECGAAE